MLSCIFLTKSHCNGFYLSRALQRRAQNPRLAFNYFRQKAPSNTAQKMKFSIKDFFSKCDQIRSFLADLVTFTEEIPNGKLHFLCSVRCSAGL